MAEVPLLPSLVAVIVALPADWPETSPLELTAATAALLVDHVTTRPLRVAPAASLVTAESCCVAPTRMVADGGLRVTEATGACVTVTLELAVVPSLVAVMVAEPAAVAVRSPLLLTVATPGVSLDHVTTRPLSGLPLASLGVAVSCAVAPACRLAVAGLTVSDATGTVVTVTAAVPLLPSLVAVIVATPAARLVTSPVALTVATAGKLLAQVTGRPGKGLPLASCGMAVSCKVAPTRTLATAGLRATEATGCDITVTVLVSAKPTSGGSVAMTR